MAVKKTERKTLTPFERLKKRIDKQFREKKFIGDISVNDEEFDILVSCFLAKYNYLKCSSMHILLDPVFATALVHLGIRYYSRGNFWGNISSALGIEKINSNHQVWIRDSFNVTLKSYGKLMLPNDDTINNILMHGFVSDYYANDFFRFLFAFYYIDLERDLERNDRSTMNSLIDIMTRDDNTGRTYYLVKQTADAVRANTRGCKIRIRRFLRLIDSCFWDRIDLSGSNHRLTKQLNNWKETSEEFHSEVYKYNVGGYIAGGKKSFSSPYFRCDFKTLRLELVLPKQLVKHEFDNNVYWEIVVDGKQHIIYNNIYEAVTGNKTEEKVLEVIPDNLFSNISINLFCNEFKIRTFKILGDCIRFFDKNGNYIRSDSLPIGEVYSLTQANEVVLSNALIDSEPKGVLLLSYFDFQIGDIIRLPDGNPISIGKKIEEGLAQRGLVSKTIALYKSEEIPIYNNEPMLYIKIPKEKVNGTAIKINENIYRMFDKETIEIKAIELDERDRTDNIGYLINLKHFNCNSDGIYNIIIDVPNDRTYRVWKFALIRNMSYEFEGSPYIFKKKGTISFSDNIKVMRFHGNVEKVAKENKYNFIIIPGETELCGEILANKEVLSVRFEIPVLNWKFDKADWEIDKPSEVWYSNFPTIIYFSYPEDILELSTDNIFDNDFDEDTCVSYKKQAKGIFKCDVTCFKSWFNRYYEKQSIYIKIQSKTLSFFEVITKSSVKSNIIKGDFDNNFILGEFEIIGQANYYVDVMYGGDLIAEKEPIINGTFKIPAKINSGKYKVSLFEDEEDDTGFGSDKYLFIDKYICDLVNPKNLDGKNLLIHHIKESENSIFKMSLNRKYKIENLKHVNDDLHTYIGHMVMNRNHSKTSISLYVNVEFYDLNKLRYAYIKFYDEDDLIEFLYDNESNNIVKEEIKELPPSVKYRRYEPLYSEEYLYVVSFV